MNLSNFSLPKLRQRDIALIIVAVTILLGVLWYFQLYSPAQERIETLNAEVVSLNEDIRIGEIARDNIEQLEAELLRLEEERRAFLAELPRESEVSSLLEQLRLGAEASGVSVESLSQSGNANESIPDIRPISFSIGTGGNYPETMTFLDILESLQRFTKIQQVGLNVQEEGVNNPELNATYDFTVYVFTGEDPGVLEQ